MKRADGQYVSVKGDGVLSTKLLDTSNPEAHGETQIYGVTAGAYYLDIADSGPWSFTFTLQR